MYYDFYRQNDQSCLYMYLAIDMKTTTSKEMKDYNNKKKDIMFYLLQETEVTQIFLSLRSD